LVYLQKQVGDARSIELAEEFKVAVLDTLNFLLHTPKAGRKRFPQFADLAGTRSWRVRPPFSRFLIYYHVKNDRLFVDRLIEGHRRETTDKD
jgi:hypothetical protein